MIIAYSLLTRAAKLCDQQLATLVAKAATHSKRGFTGGANWMREVLSTLRGTNLTCAKHKYQLYGFFKYGISFVVAIISLLTIKFHTLLLSPPSPSI